MAVQLVGDAAGGALLWHDTVADQRRLTAFIKARFSLEAGAPMKPLGPAYVAEQDRMVRRAQVEVRLSGGIPLLLKLGEAMIGRVVVERFGERVFNAQIDLGAIPPDKVRGGRVNLGKIGQLRALHGDEWLGLRGLAGGDAALATQLPQCKPAARLMTAADRALDVPLAIDLIDIDAEDRSCVVSWRGDVAVPATTDAGQLQVSMGLFGVDEEVRLPELRAAAMRPAAAVAAPPTSAPSDLVAVAPSSAPISIEPERAPTSHGRRSPQRGTVDMDISELDVPPFPFELASPLTRQPAAPQPPAVLSPMTQEPIAGEHGPLEQTADLTEERSIQERFGATLNAEAAELPFAAGGADLPFAADPASPPPALAAVDEKAPPPSLGDTCDIEDAGLLERLSRQILPFDAAAIDPASDVEADPENGPLGRTFELSGGLQQIFASKEALPFAMDEPAADSPGAAFLAALHAIS